MLDIKVDSEKGFVSIGVVGDLVTTMSELMAGVNLVVQKIADKDAEIGDFVKEVWKQVVLDGTLFDEKKKACIPDTPLPDWIKALRRNKK